MLTDGQADAAQAADKDYKLADANGLYLFVTRAGFKSWRMKYRFGGKEKRLTFGAYPEVSLAEARERRDQARRLLRDQIDPAAERSRLRAGTPAAEARVGPDELPLAPLPRPVAAAAIDLSSDRSTAARSAEVAATAIDTPPNRLAPMPPLAEPVPVVARPHEPAEPVSLRRPMVEGKPMPPVEPAPTAVRVEATPTPARPRSAGANGYIMSSLRAAGTLPPERELRAGLRPTPEPEAVRPAAVASPPSAAPIPPAAPAVTAAPAADPIPTTEAEPAMDLDAGARALALLRQAEEVAATARRESRTAKRLALAALALLLVALVISGWWLLQPKATPLVIAGLPGGAALPVAAPAAAPPAAGAAATTVAAPAAPAPAAAGPVPPSEAAAVPPSPLPARHNVAKRRHRRHHHRHHRRHRAAVAARAPSTRSPQEIHHDVQVAAPRRADLIDPALDRFGRAALCLRAAYSADPGCAAVRAAGRQ